MVGVANSAGCVTCRSRKVKCDLQRPSCGKCIKAGRDCGGYKRDRVFIIGTQQDQGRCSSHPKRAALIPRSNNKRALEQSRTHSSNSSVTTPGRSPQSSSSASSVTSISRHGSNSPQPSVQPAFANLRQFIAQNAEEFLMRPFFEHPKDTVPSLMYYLHPMANSNTLFNRGILAYCLASAGKKHNDVRLNKASFKMIVDAMREMQLALLDPHQSTRVEVLAATICMSDCEITLKAAYQESNQYYNWRSLLRGTSALVQERGPLSFSQYPDFQLFTRQFRGSGVLEAIGRRQHTYLASHDWLTLPWSKGIEKTSTDACLDIMAGLAGCLADVDQITLRSGHDPIPDCPCTTDAKSLLKKLFELANAWTIWFGNLQTEEENLCTIMPAVPSPTTYHEMPNPIFPMVFTYPNFRIGMSHMYMWSSLILIYDATDTLQNFMELDNYKSPPFSSNTQQARHANHLGSRPPAESYYTKTLREFSQNICQSLDSVLESAVVEDLSVVHMLAFPLWIVMQCYRDRSVEEDKFLDRFLKRMVVEYGLPWLEELCGMSFEDYARS